MEILMNIFSMFSTSYFKISVAIFLFILIVGMYLIQPKGKKKADKITSKIDKLRELNFEEELEEDNKSPINQTYNQYIKPYVKKNKDIYDKMLNLLGIDLEDLQKRLTRADIENFTAEQVSVFQIGGAILSIFLGFVLFLFLGTKGLFIGFAIAAGTIFLPNMLIEEKYTTRKNEIIHVLPVELQLMADATSSGHTIDYAIQKVSYKYDNLLSKEFRKAEKETKITNDWILALENLAKRNDIDELYNLVSEIKTSKEKGIPVTKILISNSEKIEKESSLRITESARKKQTTLLIPMLLFLFAPLIGLILLPSFSTIMSSL